MPSTIHKYPLGPTPGSVWVSMPEGATILSAGAQGQVPVIWALVDTDAREVGRLIGLDFTGHLVAEFPGEFIGTVTTDDGLVWHLWDRGEGGADA